MRELNQVLLLPLSIDLSAIVGSGAIKQCTSTYHIQRVIIVKEFIDENFRDEVNLDDLAMVGAISKFHLIRLFKNLIGESPYQYLLHKRLGLAVQLMKSESLNITEIAFSCGFNSRRSFSKAYKKKFGYSPSHHVELVQAGNGLGRYLESDYNFNTNVIIKN